MNHLRPIRGVAHLFVRLSFMLAAVAAMTVAVGAQQPHAAVASATESTAATAITLPDLNPAEWFDGKMGGSFGAKTVTLGQKNMRAFNEHRGVIDASQVHYANFLDQLKAAGREVVPATDLEFADLYVVDTKTGTVLSLTGADSKSKTRIKVAETNNEAYAAAAQAVLSQTTGAFARLFAANPVQ